jgi:hypothetical protein
MPKTQTPTRGYTATKDQLLARLARIEGQIRGIEGWSRTTATASTSSPRSAPPKPRWTRSRSGCSTGTPTPISWPRSPEPRSTSAKERKCHSPTRCSQPDRVRPRPHLPTRRGRHVPTHRRHVPRHPHATRHLHLRPVLDRVHDPLRPRLPAHTRLTSTDCADQPEKNRLPPFVHAAGIWPDLDSAPQCAASKALRRAPPSPSCLGADR